VISGYETVKEALVNQADAFAERPKIPVFEDLTRGNGKLVLFFLNTLTYLKKFFPTDKAEAGRSLWIRDHVRQWKQGAISLTSVHLFKFESTDSDNKTTITPTIATATDNGQCHAFRI